MPCGKNELSLSPSQVRLFLNTLHKQSLSIDEIVNTTKLPMFKVRSSLRELAEAAYIEETNGKYRLLDKGEQYL